MNSATNQQHILITGGNSGIGLATAGQLAQLGHQVTITSRDLSKGQQAQQRIAEQYQAEVDCLTLDLCSFRSIRECAASINDSEKPLDTLINNAGMSLSDRQETEDGFEAVLATNAIGPQMLTLQLLDKLLASNNPRVINLSSAGHVGARGGMNWDDLQRERKYSGQAYCQAKLAIIFFTRELARRYGDQGLQSYAVNPGFVTSGFGMDGDARGIGYLFFLLGKLWMKSPDQGAATSVWAATDQNLGEHNGAYLQKSQVSKPSSQALDDAAAKRWWDLCHHWIEQGHPA